MGWYRRMNLAFNSFQNAAGSKFSVRLRSNPVSIPSVGRTNGMSFSSTSIAGGNNCTATNQFKIGLSGYSAILSKFGNLGALKPNQSKFAVASRRNYYIDNRQIYHFKPRGYRKWFQEPRNVLIVVLVGSGVVVTFYFGHLETIPYTKRRHCVLLSKSLEVQLGESQFKQVKEQFKGKILPPIHPDSVRVRLIAKDIIGALQRGLSHERVWSDPGYGSDSPGSSEYDQHLDGQDDAKAALSEGAEFKFESDWKKEGEILDDKWVKESRSKGQARGMQPATHHLEDLKWEVLVVNEPVVNAFCMPGGKIVVFTGLLDHFRTDAEIATIIGHEVGHAVARHAAEQITKNMWLAIIQMVMLQFVDPHLIQTMSNLLLRLPFSRKMEIEADYIGLLLTASAGYDPRVAPMVYQKLGKVSGESALRDYLSTHPSGKTRAQLLARAQVMEEAMALFREARAGRGIEGFL